MKIIYARQALPELTESLIIPNSIFLAGPTPRSKDVPSWRPQALEYLKNAGFTGTIFVPEDEEWGLTNVIYEQQTRWEIQALGRSQCIVFWVPRKLPEMPAFTTNTEYGLALGLAVKRIVLGTPDDAQKVKYQQQLATDINLVYEAFTGNPCGVEIPVCNTLEETLDTAIQMAA